MDEKTAAYYRLRAVDLSRQYRSANVEHLSQKLKAVVSPGLTVLDLGCGTGREAAFLFGCGAMVWGADASPEMLHEAQEAFRELRGRLLQFTLPSVFPFHSACFDLLISISVLMHLDPQDLPGVFAEISRVLKPGGRVIFSVPLNRADVLAGRDTQGRRFNELPAQAWKKLAVNAGLTLVEERSEPDGLGRESTSWLTFEFVLEK